MADLGNMMYGAPTVYEGPERVIKVTRLEPIPVGDNPFHHDIYNMGITVSKNCLVMLGAHPHEHADYLIIVDRTSGERMKLELAKP